MMPAALSGGTNFPAFYDTIAINIIAINLQKLTSAHELESLFEIFGVDGQVGGF